MVLKTYFKRQNPKLIGYRKCKNFNLNSEIYTIDKSLKDFPHSCLRILHSFAPLKTKSVRASNTLQKAIMTRSKLRNESLIDETESCRKSYCKQRNIFVNILRKTKKQHHKKFWETVKNLFSHKSNNFKTITLVEIDMIISDDQKITDIFIQYFNTIVPKLG